MPLIGLGSNCTRNGYRGVPTVLAPRVKLSCHKLTSLPTMKLSLSVTNP